MEAGRGTMGEHRTQELDDGEDFRDKKVTSKFYLCGDEKSDVADGIGLVSSRVMICAAHQAHTVLRILANNFEE